MKNSIKNDKVKVGIGQQIINIMTTVALGLTIALFVAAMIIIPASVEASDLEQSLNRSESVVGDKYTTYVKDNTTFGFMDYDGKKLVISGVYGSSEISNGNGEEKVTEFGGRVGESSDNSSVFVCASYTDERDGTKWYQTNLALQAQGDPQTVIDDILEVRLLAGGEAGFIKLDTSVGTDTGIMYGVYGGVEFPILDALSFDVTYHYGWTRLEINNVEVDNLESLKFALNLYL